jgi:hypothetical protein
MQFRHRSSANDAKPIQFNRAALSSAFFAHHLDQNLFRISMCSVGWIECTPFSSRSSSAWRGPFATLCAPLAPTRVPWANRSFYAALWRLTHFRCSCRARCSAIRAMTCTSQMSSKLCSPGRFVMQQLQALQCNRCDDSRRWALCMLPISHCSLRICFDSKES